jgi:hypothetical protein
MSIIVQQDVTIYSLFISANCSKHVEQCTDINKLYIVTSCWTIIDIILSQYAKCVINRHCALGKQICTAHNELLHLQSQLRQPCALNYELFPPQVHRTGIKFVIRIQSFAVSFRRKVSTETY